LLRGPTSKGRRVRGRVKGDGREKKGKGGGLKGPHFVLAPRRVNPAL